MSRTGPLARWLVAPVSSRVAEVAASTFVRGVSFTIGARLAGLVVGVATLTATARWLGPEGRGQYAVVMTLLGLVVQFSHCGLHTSSVHFLARRPGERRRVAGILLWFSLAVTGLLAVGAYAVAASVPTALGATPTALVALGLAAAPPCMFVLVAGNALLGLGETRWFAGLELGWRVVGLLAAASLLWSSLAELFAVQAALVCLLAAVAYLRLVGPSRPATPEWTLTGRMLGYGFRAFLASVMTFLIMRIGVLLVNTLAGTAAAGGYSVALNVAELLNLAASSVGVVFFRKLSTMEAARRWAATRRVAAATGVILAALAAGLAVLGRPVFHLWFGPAFDGSVEGLWWLLPGMWCLGVNSIFYQYLAASGMPWFLVAAPAIGAIVVTVSSVAAIPAAGLIGAAGALSGTGVLLLLLSLWYVRRYVPALTPELTDSGGRR